MERNVVFSRNWKKTNVIFVIKTLGEMVQDSVGGTIDGQIVRVLWNILKI